MENRFEIIVKDKKTNKTVVALNLDDDWISIDDEEFTASISDVVERIQQADDSGALFGL